MVFSCGTQAIDWVENNCANCKKYDADSAENTTCEFSNKVVMGCFGEAPSIEEFKQYGFNKKPNFKCNQIDLVSE